MNSPGPFRDSALSAASGVIDFTADTRAKYFSLDNGATNIAGLSTGRNFGDGQQNSHWNDKLGIGILDPTAGTGELLANTANGKLAFDLIGWNLATAVPEPATCAMSGAGLLALALRRRLGAAHSAEPRRFGAGLAPEPASAGSFTSVRHTTATGDT